MKKLLVLAMVAVSLHLAASPVDSLNARLIAQHFFRMMHPEKGSVALIRMETTHYKGVVTRYTAIFENNDFVIISANDATVPVFAFSREQSFSSGEESPEYLWWLENEYDKLVYKAHISHADNAETIGKWDSIRKGHQLPNKAESGVLPLITSRWGQTRTNDQYCPGYNALVPSPNPGCNCGKCTAGCVAVAMAQIMNYWHFPESGANRTFDWCHMPDYLIKNEGGAERPGFATECDAIAGLLGDCGTTATLEYCSSNCATASTIGRAGQAIQHSYGYSSEMQHRYRWLTSNWKTKLRDCLDHGIPVLYGGQSEYAGHAFVCDGYEDADFFHFNWGWNGYSNGYFYIAPGDGSPEINYDGFQEALFYIHPEEQNILSCPTCLDSLTLSSILSVPYRPDLPNILWSGLPYLYNYFPPANPYLPANAELITQSGELRLKYRDIIAGTINAAQVVIPDKVNVQFKAYQEITLSDFETEWGAEFTAEIIECDGGSKSVQYASAEMIASEELNLSAEPASNVGFSLWPNPACSSFNIEFLSEINDTFIIILRNIHGNELLRITGISTDKGIQHSEISIEQLSPGLYLIEFRNNCSVWEKKVIVE